MYCTCIFLLWLSFCLCYDAARILIVVPTPSKSHQVVFYPLTKELIKQNHEVVVITTDPAFPKRQKSHNLTEIDLHDVLYKIVPKEMSAMKIGSGDDVYDQMDVVFKTLRKTFEIGIQTAEVQNLLQRKEDYFDLLIIEAFSRPALIFTNFFKAPVISMCSYGATIGTHTISGTPIHPLLYPSVYQHNIYNSNIWSNIMRLWKHFQHESLIARYESMHDNMLRKIFGSNVLLLQELAKNIDMTFLNVHPMWADNQPTPPSVVFLGGLHNAADIQHISEGLIQKGTVLPQDLKSYLDSSKHGVVYMSLGNNVQLSQLGSKKKAMLLKVFAELPYDFLVKWDTANTTHPENVRLFKWVPQSNLLKHPKVKLFITQCGLQSTDEAIVAGVPVIGLPMFTDQFYNAEKYLKYKIGLKYEMKYVAANELKEAIKRVIDDKSYHDNIIGLRSVISDRLQTSLERAIWWTEHILRHGGAKHLRAPAANMSWVEYFELDLVLILLVSLLTLVAFIYASLYYGCRFIFIKFKMILNKQLVTNL